MKRAKRSPYSVGLGKEILHRASLIFLITLSLTLLLLSTSIYMGFKDGKIQQQILEPLKSFIQNIGKEFQESEKSVDSRFNIESSSSGTVKIEFNNGTSKQNTETTSPQRSNSTGNSNKSTPSSSNTYILKQSSPIPYPSQKSWEQLLKEQEEWSNAKRQENQNWLNQQTDQAKKAQDEWWSQKTKEFEEFKTQHGL